MYFIVCLIAPPPGKPYVKEYFGNEGHGDMNVIDGREGSDFETTDLEKTEITPTKP